VGEKNIPLFDATLDETPDKETIERQTDQQDNEAISESHAKSNDQHADQCDDIPVEPIQQMEPIQPEIRQSSQVAKPSTGFLQSREYQQREEMGCHKGEEWTTQAGITLSSLSDTQDDYIACLAETKASHNIPRSYQHAMSTDPDKWMIPMQVEMETLKAKHMWYLVKLPPGANIMDLMWVYDIKWNGEGNRIKDKARLVGKGYTQ